MVFAHVEVLLSFQIWSKGFFDTPAGSIYWVYFAGPVIAAVVGPLCYYLMYGTVRPGTMATAQSDRAGT